MKVKLLCLIIALGLCVGMVGAFQTPVLAATTWYVDDDKVEYPGADFTTIQDAVDAASEGDTIIVYPGTYVENVDVDKRLTIQSNSGNPADTIVSAANPDDHVFDIAADQVTIDGFTTTGATFSGKYGIYLSTASYCTICNNHAENNHHGIGLVNTSNNTVSDNTAINNIANGISVLSESCNNTVSRNTVDDNNTGIRIVSSSNSNTIEGNTASDNSRGIYLLLSCDDNAITNNTILNSTGYGILMEVSSSNTITGNTVKACSYRGIRLYDANANTIYNNYFENSTNTEDNGSNTWNTEKTFGANIIGGPFLGGNYWSDYGGTDTDGDGLGNTLLPYNSGGGIVSGGDNLPLVYPDGPVMPDLIVVEKWEEWVSLVDKSYNVTYTIGNQGLAASGACHTRVYIDAGTVADEYYDCPALDPGESDSKEVGPFTMTGDSDSILVWADPNTEVAESDEDNNGLENAWGTLIVGVMGEANCEVVPEATVTLYDGGGEVATTVSGGDGSYKLSVPGTGDYDVTVSKTGYKDETHSINIGVAGQEYTVDMIGETGLVPKAATMAYVLECVNHWLYPPGDECDLSMAKVLATVNAWLYPT